MTAAYWQDRLDTATQRLAEMEARTAGPTDPAVVNQSPTARNKAAAAAGRRRFARIDGDLTRHRELTEEVALCRSRLVRAQAREREAARVQFTAADLANATHVRTIHGWYEVVRINTKTVTVKTGHSRDDLVLIAKILEHRTVTS